MLSPLESRLRRSTCGLVNKSTDEAVAHGPGVVVVKFFRLCGEDDVAQLDLERLEAEQGCQRP